jgi:hypothetical protein
MMGFYDFYRVGSEELFQLGINFFSGSRGQMVIVSPAAMQVNPDQVATKKIQQLSLSHNPKVFLGRSVADIVPIADTTALEFLKNYF